MSDPEAGKRFLKLFNCWLAQCPQAFREHIQRMISAEFAKSGQVSVANLRASEAERRERDTATEVRRLQRRIAELESRP